MQTGLLLLIGLVLLPVLGFGFVYDDGWTLVANGFLRVPGDLPVLLSPEAVARNIPDAFRPGLVVFDMLSYQVFGLDARWHHGLSWALHLGVCAAGAAWLRRLGAPQALWAGTLAVYGLLAIHAEAIAVVSFREDLLATLLALLAAWLASVAIRRSRAWPWSWFLPVAGLMGLACACKQSAAVMPVFWLMAESVAPWQARRPWRRLASMTVAMVVGVAVVVGLTVWLYGGLSPYGATNLRLYSHRVGLGPVLAASSQLHLMYLQQMLVPLGLSPEYEDYAASWGDLATILACMAWLTLAGYAGFCVRRRPVVAMAIFGALILAVPTSNLAAMPNMRADRFMYLPSFPVCLGVAAGLVAAGRWLARRVAAGGGGSALAVVAPLASYVVLQGMMLVGTTFTYRSNGSLWAVAHREAPGSARAQAAMGELLAHNLGPELSQERRAVLLARVAGHCHNAERLDPTYELPQLCFARLAAAEKDWAEARRRFAAALAFSPDRNARIYAGLAQTSLDLPGHSQAQRRALAQEALEAGLAAYPYAPELHEVAGKIYHRLGEPAAAFDHYTRAQTLAPERGGPLLGRVSLALDVGLPAAAWWLVAANRRGWLAADPTDRTALIARHRDALRFLTPTMIVFADLDGVFANEP